jgi:hypothetical protein
VRQYPPHRWHSHHSAAAVARLASALEAAALLEWLRGRLARGGRLGRRLQRRLASSGGRNAARARAAGWQVLELAEEELPVLPPPLQQTL